MRDCRPILLFRTAPLSEAYRLIDVTGLAIALVIDHEGKLLGTITDGDLRRGLFRGLTMEDSVESVMHSQPISALTGSPIEEIQTLMKSHVVNQIPIVDAQGKVIGLEVMADSLLPAAVLTNPVVIFAGGEGKRLRPLTENTPKPMLPVGGRPLLERLIERLTAQGFR
jgi:signal-transduction protein with cAMP-binding, CBS, and nucleotidyltransferase domain